MARASKGLVVCINNEGYSVALERRKLYVTMPDAATCAASGLTGALEKTCR